MLVFAFLPKLPSSSAPYDEMCVISYNTNENAQITPIHPMIRFDRILLKNRAYKSSHKFGDCRKQLISWAKPLSAAIPQAKPSADAHSQARGNAAARVSSCAQVSTRSNPRSTPGKQTELNSQW